MLLVVSGPIEMLIVNDAKAEKQINHYMQAPALRGTNFLKTNGEKFIIMMKVFFNLKNRKLFRLKIMWKNHIQYTVYTI